jgi:cobalt-zinc-cadmium efflux system protein
LPASTGWIKTEPMEHGHRHDAKSRLRAALAVIGAIFLVEVAGGIVTGSLALLADAGHMMTDLGALAIAYGATVMAERRPTRRHTYGFHRAEVLAAFVNAELILLLSAAILFEGARRLASPPDIEPLGVLAIGSIGLVANLAAFRLLHRHGETRLHLRAAALEILVDLFASIAVVAGAATMLVTGWRWIDPVLSIAIGLAILPRAIHLLRESAHILLEGAPSDVDLDRVRDDLQAIAGVEEIHDLHVWTLTSGLHSASVHIRAAIESPRGAVLHEVRRVLREDAGVEHATVQVEWGPTSVCQTTEHHFDGP